MAVPGYVAVSVTLSDTNSHNLLALMIGIVPAMAGVLQNCGALSLQADVSNGSNSVYVGDSAISTTRYGYALLAHDQVPYHSPLNNNVPLNQIYLLASTSPCQVNVECYFI